MSHKAKLEVFFEDGTSEVIEVTDVLLLKIPGRSVDFRQDKKGVWRMVVTEDFLKDRRLASPKMLQLTRDLS